MEVEINQELIEYIEKNILPEYDKNEPGHGRNHIQDVIKRMFELMEGREVNHDMAYTIAAFHDIGHHIDRENHEKVSAEIFMKDEVVKKWFSEEERKCIKEAIEDHRASSNKEPRSIYGKLIASADKGIVSINVNGMRAYYGAIERNPGITREQAKQVAYEHLVNKYGKKGYAHMYITDDKFEEAQALFQKQLENKELFMKELEKILKENGI